jgi:hypothetical protein
MPRPEVITGMAAGVAVLQPGAPFKVEQLRTVPRKIRWRAQPSMARGMCVLVDHD